MFSTGSPYSPFFTSGLLSAQLLAMDTPTSSRAPSPEIQLPLGPRRGSLPTDNLAATSPLSQDESAAFYFTMQPKRDETEFRSFLSLDLAESQSMRSASLKRKASSKGSRSRSSKANTGLSIPSRIPEVSVPRMPSPARRMRYSRDSPLPSPKPVPSITLPELPKEASDEPPRLPSLVKTPSLSFSFPAPPPTSPKKSFLPSLRVSRTRAPKSVIQLANNNRASVQTTSSVSTRVKKVNRSDALARLEGRVKPSRLSFTPSRNFMSMSDDEEEDQDSDAESLGAKSDYTDLGDDLFYAFFEPEDLVLPASLPSTSPISPSHPIAHRRNSSSPTKSSFARMHFRRSTKEWFPLKSFIDLRNDDESSASTWSWRSFIDVASIS
ncbi:hypothetical protein CC2G_011797 [Coprinopsis cinerea AmutBmut pab1-1]|nr:hypothetical protein CC2G_011797 [Coprinopsis cinerea AmutBmut pab1-1]